MKSFKYLAIIFSYSFTLLTATDFTVSTYNCGGLSEHYDYLRAVTMQKLMQERYSAEPREMELNDKIQKLALKILFAPEQEKLAAKQEWDQKKYQRTIDTLTSESTNKAWGKKCEEMITNYKIRPVVIHDQEINSMLNAHLRDLAHNKKAGRLKLLDEVRNTMAKRTFQHYLKFDIICLQEADYLDASLFPEHYEVLFAETAHSKNGIAWNTNRFELVESLGDILGRAFAVKLLEKESGKTVLVASGHITGCHPYRVENGDSAKGDSELKAIVDLFDNNQADLMVIGMDSNVTSLHPRLNILKDAHYQLDYENYIEPTCANPNLVLNTRIDWIALKSNVGGATVTNIPVNSVGLNSMQTNMSDHKPIAAKITVD